MTGNISSQVLASDLLPAINNHPLHSAVSPAAMAPGRSNGVHVPFHQMTFDSNDAEASALRIVTEILPDWKGAGSKVEFVRFTDGITNTLLKAVNRREGLSDEEIDNESILLRAYGHGTDVLIDRHRETQNHELLMKHGLAPELIARFSNGMVYRFIRGRVTSPEDLRKPEIYTAVARRLAEWHATVPCLHETFAQRAGLVGSTNTNTAYEAAIDHVAAGKAPPNVWTVMQKWILALPKGTDEEKKRQGELQMALTRQINLLSQRPGLGKNGLVFAHCDLLSGNVIVEPKTGAAPGSEKTESVQFIDYEYATPSPAAFDLANHFAEWGGFTCDYSVLPTRQQRFEFIREYIHTYFDLVDEQPENLDLEVEVTKLFHEVDMFRGLPGLYWGIWALIQATISRIDFNYGEYAEIRLAEYEAWWREANGRRVTAREEIPLRERRWAQANDES